MKSTQKNIQYTSAVLKEVCKQQGVSKRKYRLDTLKYIHEVLCLLIENGDFSDRARNGLKDLDRAARLAIGEE